MEKEKQALRKRAVITLGYLVEIINEQQYDLIVNNIRDACIANEGNLTSLRIYLLAVSTVCRSTSSRFSSYLPEVNYRFSYFLCRNFNETFFKVCTSLAQIL
jgi:hypothetical protein